jgi:hypothetical protein
MAERWFVPEKKVKRSGVFEGRTIHAWMWVNEKGQMGWAVKTWTDEESQLIGYWIANGEIRDIGTEPDMRIGGLITEMDESEKEILLNAIKKWQAEEIENPCT